MVLDSMVRTLGSMFGWNDTDALENMRVMFPTFGDSRTFEQHVNAAAAITSSLLQSRGQNSSPFAGAGVSDMLTAGRQSQDGAAKSMMAGLGHGVGDDEVLHQIQQAQQQLQQQQSSQGQQQQARRGRPCKQGGQLSKGYLATKRYRQRKRDQVQNMEVEVLKKMEQLIRLRKEQQQLRQKEQVLQHTLSLIDSMLPQLAELDMGLECEGTCSKPAAVAQAEAAKAAAAASACLQGTLEGLKVSGSTSGEHQQQQGGLRHTTSDSGNSNASSQPDWLRQLGSMQQAATAARMQQQQWQRQQSIPDPAALLQKYRDYVTDAAARLAAMAAFEQSLGHQQQRKLQLQPVSQGLLQLQQQEHQVTQGQAPQQQQQMAGSAAGCTLSVLTRTGTTDATGFPSYPLTVIESLALWKLISISSSLPANKDSSTSSCSSPEVTGPADRALEPPPPAAAAAAPVQRSNSQPRMDLLVLNLETGEHCLISEDFWAKVAEQVPVRPEQTQQLDAALKLILSALGKINEDRRQLVQQLQAAAGLGGSDAASCAAETSSAASSVPREAAGAAGASGSATAADVSSGAAGRAAERPNGQSARHAVDYCFALSDDLQRHLQLADAVEANLLRGRAVALVYGWSLKASFDNEQFARMCVASWPHFPLMRSIVAHKLGWGEVALPVRSLAVRNLWV